LHSSLQLVVNC